MSEHNEHDEPTGDELMETPGDAAATDVESGAVDGAATDVESGALDAAATTEVVDEVAAEPDDSSAAPAPAAASGKAALEADSRDGAAPARRRFIDYPRGGRTGVRRWLPSWRLILAAMVAGVLAVFGALATAVAVVKVPEPNEIARAQATTFYWNDGQTVLGLSGEANRTSVPLDEVPDHVRKAVLAAEDRSFYDHGGFSVEGITRAAVNNVIGDGGTQGGSTITQQYAKNAFLSSDQTLTRKLKELVLSIKLDSTQSKDQILADYLNTVYYGRGAYGIEAAAKAYFGVPASQLTAPQGAVLASLLQAPTSLAPENDPAGLAARWNYVLDGMVEQGWLSQEQRAAATMPEFVPAESVTDYYSGTNGYLLSAAQQQMVRMGYTDKDFESAGLTIVTTFDQAKQAAAVDAVSSYAPTENADGLRVGLVSIDPQTGAVVAMYGGADYAVDKFNNATQATGQAGSTFKAFGLAAGLEAGVDLNSTFSGVSPMEIDGYKVENYANESYGNVSMLYSTINSVNTSFLAMNSQIGPEKTKQALIAAGIPADAEGLDDGTINVLGPAYVTPMDSAKAFATLAARGENTPASTIAKITDRQGKVLYELEPDPQRAFSQEVADRVTYALRKVVTSGTGTAAQLAGRPVAGKTGTTDNFMSAWFGGYTPQLATSVMMVRSDAAGNAASLEGVGGYTEMTGGSLPAKIFGAYTNQALADTEVEYFAEPQAVSDLVVPDRRQDQRRQEAPADPTTPSPSPSTQEPTPSPSAPSPVAPVVPSPVVPSPVAPVVPSPVPPSPVVPSPVAPTPPAPSPTAPASPAWPSPVASGSPAT